MANTGQTHQSKGIRSRPLPSPVIIVAIDVYKSQERTFEYEYRYSTTWWWSKKTLILKAAYRAHGGIDTAEGTGYSPAAYNDQFYEYQRGRVDWSQLLLSLIHI